MSELDFNLGIRYSHLPFPMQWWMLEAYNLWDYQWFRHQPYGAWRAWNVDAVGTVLFAETFMDPVRHLMPDVAWFDA